MTPRPVAQAATQSVPTTPVSAAVVSANASSACSPVEQVQLQALNGTIAQWSDAEKLASSTSRIALAGPVAQLQSIRRETSGVLVPNCAVRFKQSLLTAMDAEINAFLTFQATGGEAGIARANEVMIVAQNELAIALGQPTATPVPTPRAILQWIPGIVGTDIIAFAEARQFTCSTMQTAWTWMCIRPEREAFTPSYELRANGDGPEKITYVIAKFSANNKSIDSAAEAEFLMAVARLRREDADADRASKWVQSQLTQTGDQAVIEALTVIGTTSLHLFGRLPGATGVVYLEITPGFAQ